MKKVLLYGNCQIGSLAKILKSLYPHELEIFAMQQVQKISDNQYFSIIRPIIEASDIVILQNVNQPEKDPFEQIIPYLKKNIKVIFIDSLFNRCYNPELIITDIIPGFRAGKSHDINIIKACCEKIPLDNFLQNDPFHQKNFYTTSHFSNILQQTIDELESRQQTLKAKITNRDFEHISIIPYILQNSIHHESALWGDHNHPKLEVYKYIVQKIIELGVIETFDNELFEQSFDAKSFTGMNYPSYLSTSTYFNFLEDNENDLYCLGGMFFDKTREEYVREVYKYYAMIEDRTLLEVYRQATN